MNLFKLTLLILTTVLTVASSNENNQTADLNQSKIIPSSRMSTIGIIVAPSIQNNEYIEWEIEIGNPSYKETLVSKGTFKLIDTFGNILNQTFAKFTVPPRKSRTYTNNSFKVKVSKDTKAYIQANLGGVISRSNYFIIYK